MMPCMAYIGLITLKKIKFVMVKDHIFFIIAGYVCNIDKYYIQENKMMDAIEQKTNDRILMGKDHNVVAKWPITKK